MQNTCNDAAESIEEEADENEKETREEAKDIINKQNNFIKNNIIKIK